MEIRLKRGGGEGGYNCVTKLPPSRVLAKWLTCYTQDQINAFAGSVNNIITLQESRKSMHTNR